MAGGIVLTTDRNGNADQAYQFNGTNSRITITNWNSLTGNAARTMSIWFKTNGYPSFGQVFMAWGVGAANQTNWLGTYVDAIRLLGFFAFSNDLYVLDQSQFYDNSWHQMTVTFDGATIKLFIDGVLLNSGSKTLNTGRSILSIGSNVTATDFFKGSLDEVRIYNRGLTDTEVQQMYLAETPATVSTSDVIKLGAEPAIPTLDN